MTTSKPSATLKVLMEMRDVMTEMRNGISRLEDRVERVEHRLVESDRHRVDTEIRVATALTDVVITMRDVRDLLLVRLDDRERVNDIDRRLTVVESRIG